MAINPHIFRSYDIRGIVDESIDADTYYLLGRAYATYLVQRHISSCPVGLDNRASSPAYYQSFCHGLHDGGVNTISLGDCLSPILYFANYHFKTRAGAMITASHLPINYNGLKLMSGYSTPMSHSALQYLRQLIDNSLFSTGNGVDTPVDIFDQYESHILSYFPNQKPLRVVVDACGTNSGIFYPKILAKLGHQIIGENLTPDPNFSLGTPDPLDVLVTTRLSASVIKHGADIGFSYDADGDRLGVVDHTGASVSMDQIISLFAKQTLQNIPGSSIVFNTLNSRLVPRIISQHHGRPVMAQTGRSFIKLAMDQSNAPFGGELSGHLFFDDQFFGHDDAVYASLRLIQYLQDSNQNLHQHLLELPNIIASPEIKLGISDDIKFNHITNVIGPKIQQYDKSAHFTQLDGVRLESTDFLITIRASQNGAYLAIKFDADTESRYQSIQKFLSSLFQDSAIYDWSTGSNTTNLRHIK